MALLSVRLEENTRRAIRRALAAGTLRAAIVPVASTEQHNEHLALNHDTQATLWLACKAAEAVFPAAVVTPPISIGLSEHWMEHPGTLTLTPETFAQVVFEVCHSLRRHGVTRIMILNGHGGNRRTLERNLENFRRRLGARLVLCSYWEAYTAETIPRTLVTGECPGHAGEFETSVALAAFPDAVHALVEPYPESELRISEPSHAADDRRFFAGAQHASREKGLLLLEIAVRWLTTRLGELLAD